MKTLGFTFDEKILNEFSIEAFFDQFPLFDAMEIAPDLSLLNLSTYKKIVQKTDSHNFHVPYFVSPMKYDFSSEHYKSDYTKLLSIIESLRQFSVKTPSIVIHGGTILSNRDKAFNQTLKGLDFLMNFIHKKNLDVHLQLETLANSSPVIGSRNDVLDIVTVFDDSRLSICLDINHDYHNHRALPDEAFLKKVSYIHLHHEHDSFTKWPDEALDFHLDCTYNLELLMAFCSNYRNTLISDYHAFKFKE